MDRVGNTAKGGQVLWRGPGMYVYRTVYAGGFATVAYPVPANMSPDETVRLFGLTGSIELDTPADILKVYE